MKKLIFTITIITALFATSLSQDFVEVDMKDIESKTTDSLSYLYYPVLLDRYMSFDSTLTIDDYKYLYYGYVFTDMYNPYGSHEQEDEFYNLYYEGNYEEALPIGEQIFLDNPINTKLVFKLLVCHHQIKNPENAEKYSLLYYGLLRIIYFSGDGESVETAFKVITVSDEYEILSELGLKSTGQALIGTCDRLSIEKNSQDVEKGKKKIKKLFFDVSLAFEYLNKQYEN
jgi:hypothetical protein